MNAFTVDVLQEMIKLTNKELKESGSSYFYKIGDPNGIEGVDLFHNTKGLIVNNNLLKPRLLKDSDQYLGKK